MKVIRHTETKIIETEIRDQNEDLEKATHYLSLKVPLTKTQYSKLKEISEDKNITPNATIKQMISDKIKEYTGDNIITLSFTDEELEKLNLMKSAMNCNTYEGLIMRLVNPDTFKSMNLELLNHEIKRLKIDKRNKQHGRKHDS